MFENAPIVWILVTAAAIGLPAVTVLMLYRGTVAAGLGHRSARQIAAGAAAALAAYLGVVVLLGIRHLYGTNQGFPWLAVVVLVGLTGMLLATRLPLLDRVLTAPGTPVRLVVPHTVRILGVVFLLVMAAGRLPAAFALPAGLGDMAIGVAAPLVARKLAAGKGRAAARRFHLTGIVDLIVAGSLGYLLYAVIDVTPSSAPLLALPLALIPAVPVPLAIALHVAGLRRLPARPQPHESSVLGGPLSRTAPAASR